MFDQTDRFLKLSSVQEQTGFSSSTIRRRISDGAFPAGYRVGCKSVRWLQSEVQEYIKGCVSAARGGGK